MTPGPLRPESVQRRLVEVSRLLDVLEKYRALSGEDLRADLERRLVIERALSQVVDLAVKINTHVAVAAGHPPPQDYHSSFRAAHDVGLLDDALSARLAPSAGLRNRLVHQYDDIDMDIVAAAIDGAVDGYRQYISIVARWLQART